MSGRYGPNTARVEALIETIETITPEQGIRLEHAWVSAWDEAWENAREAAQFAISQETWDAIWSTSRNASWIAAPGAIWCVIWDAVVALTVRDLISEEDFDLLYRPWRSVMEVEK